MSNHEEPPRHRGEYQAEDGPPTAPSGEQPPRSQVASDTYIRHVLGHAPSPAAAETITTLYERYGTPFAIYLALDGVDKYVRDNGEGPRSSDIGELASDFNGAYYAHFPNDDALVEDTIDSFGWRAEAQRLLRDDPMLLAVLSFDHGAISRLTREHYEVVEADDGLYVYHR